MVSKKVKFRKVIHRKYQKYKYDPVQAIRYHFTEFNVWVAFFVSINGGLLTAYFNNKVNEAIKYISKLGFIISILFFICGLVYCICMIMVSKVIKEYFEKYLNKFKKFPSPLGFTKIATTIIVMIIAIFLTITWGKIIFL